MAKRSSAVVVRAIEPQTPTSLAHCILCEAAAAHTQKHREDGETACAHNHRSHTAQAWAEVPMPQCNLLIAPSEASEARRLSGGTADVMEVDEIMCGQ